MNKTRREYLKRIHVVLDYIEKHLDTNLSLERLSQKAHYSPYHFHRVFSTVIGENLNAYIIRKRVERISAILLVEQNAPLKDLAYTYGFNSDNSFSRAFKKYYGISPTQFKLEGKKLLSNIGIAPFSSEKYLCEMDNIKQWITMNAKITVQELPEIKLAGISHIGDFDKIGAMYQRLTAWGHKKEVLPTSGFKAITIYHDNPNVTQTSKLRFSTCITISGAIKPEEEIRPFTIQKGYYAVGQFEISATEIPKAWQSMCIWVIENGYEFRDGNYFESYYNDHSTHPEQKFILDICIPLERPDNIKSDETHKTSLDYHQLIDYMKTLRGFFYKAYETHFKLGNLYLGHPEYSYFSLTTASLKKLKLKFVIILNHNTMGFSICLSGQNKGIRKTYWEMFKGSDWDTYRLAESIDDSLSIIDHTIIENPNFDNKEGLTAHIETEALKFIKNITAIFE